MTERFTRSQFEEALPRHKSSGQVLWNSLGLFEGEYCYEVPVRGNVFIKIRSSVMSDGIAADTAANSIRCWLVDETGHPISNKLQAYVTRVPGWEARLVEQLRTLFAMGMKASGTCPKCGERLKVFMTKKGSNKGRAFLRCTLALPNRHFSDTRPSCDYFKWLDEVVN